MPYASGRVIHDADAHIMELPGFLTDHLEARHRAAVTDTVLFPRREGFHSHRTEAHQTGAVAEVDEQQIMLRKNWDALGASRNRERPRSVDLLGFASQLMFTTALLNYSSVLEGGRDPELTYAVARAHTRHMVEFCSVDRRLLPTGCPRGAMSRPMWKEISISTPIMCIALPSKLAGDFTSAPASKGAGLGSAVGVLAPTFQPATGPVAFATPSWIA
jgi:hypothetical protein